MNATQSSIFIGSSSESIEYANALQSVLDDDMVTTVWRYGVFGPTSHPLPSLIDHAQKTDFAALFLTPDDESTVRGQYLKTPRDNLVFEAGLFLGHLSPQRVFLLVPREGVELPSDLQGVTSLRYRADRPDEDTQNAVNPAATEIRKAVRRVGPRPRADGGAPELAAARRELCTEVLLAIGRLGGVAQRTGSSLRIMPSDEQFEIAIVDSTQLHTSVVVDLTDPSAAAALTQLGDGVAASTG